MLAGHRRGALEVEALVHPESLLELELALESPSQQVVGMKC